MTTTDNLRDAAYIVIGLGVIGYQRVQVRRQELEKRLAAQRSGVEALLGEAFKQADANINKVLRRS
jgi:hypothetical protein